MPIKEKNANDFHPDLDNRPKSEEMLAIGLETPTFPLFKIGEQHV